MPINGVTMYKRVSVRVSDSDVDTAYIDAGRGPVVLLLHGSGPGVSAAANWSTTVPALAEHFRVVAPDLLGFGDTLRPLGLSFAGPVWVEHIIGLLDALGVDECSVVGNSFGGSLSLRLSLHAPERVRRQVLMGPGGVAFTLTPQLEAAWGYQGTTEDDMRALLRLFVHDPTLVTDDVVRARNDAALRPGVLEEYAQMFPPPRQKLLDAGALTDRQFASVVADTLLIHGREDQIVPLSVAVDMVRKIPNAQLHVFGKCGHWVQIEQAARFNRLVLDFLQS